MSARLHILWLGFGLSIIGGCGDDGHANLAGTVILDTVPTKVSHETRPVFTFHEEGGTAALSCTLDGGLPGPCTSPMTVDVNDGPHTFAVTIVDAGDPASYDWRVDTTPPETTITGQPPALDSSTSPMFTFEGSPASDVASFECALDSAAFAACTSPSTLTVAEGQHEFRVRAIDEAGNADLSPAQVTWMVDSTAPSVTITSGPSGPTNLVQATFEFAVAGGVTAVDCAVDGGTFAACSSPTTTPTLAQGAHMFVVRVKDGAGNMAMDSRSFTIDTLAPGVTITGGPSGPTNISMPQWTFTTTGSPSAVECKIDLGSFSVCAGMFMTGLADGTHVFTVRASDAAGNTATDSRTVIVDTVVPTVAITSGPQGPTTITAPAFTFTVTDSPTAIECRMDTGTFGPCTTPSSFLSPVLSGGAHTFEVRVTDDAGNTSSATRAFSVDTDGPTVTITSGPTGATSNSTATFAFTTAGSPVTTQCRFDTFAFADCSGGTYSAQLNDGPHVFEVSVADAAGNLGQATQAFTVDTMAPTVAITGGPTGTTSVTTPTFTFTTSGASTISCRVDAGTPVACTTSFTSPALGGGPHTFTVDVADAAGNTATASRSFTVDSLAPSVSITSSPADPSNPGTAAFTFTYGATTATVTCAYDAFPAQDCLGTAGSGSFSFAAGGEGAHTFTVTACNGAGVCANDARTFTVDRTPPVISLVTPPDPNNLKVVTFTFTVTGAPTVVHCKIDNSVLQTCATSFVTPTLADIQHTFFIEAIDAAGNVSNRTFTWLTDTVAPTVMLTGGPTGPTNLTAQADQSFTFSTGGNPSSTMCWFGSDTPVDCSAGSFAVPSVYGDTAHDGIYTFHVKVTDLATNSFTLDQAFTVDTHPEAAQISIANGAVTSDASPDFTLSLVDAGSTSPVTAQCRVYLGTTASGSFAACGSLADATGNLTPVTFNPGSLTDGSYTLEVKTADPAANSATTLFSFQVDTQPPSITNVAVSTAPLPALSFTASDASTSGTPAGTFSVTCYVDPATLPPTTGGTDCTAGSFTAPSSIADGAHTYYIRSHDNAVPANNAITDISVPFVVDRTGPIITLVTLDVSPPTGVTFLSQPPIRFTVADSTTGTITTTCTIDGANAPCSSGALFTAAAPLSRGVDHNLVITATDSLGNSSTLTPNPTKFRVVAPPAVAVQNCFNGLAVINNAILLCTEANGPWRMNLGTGVWEDINFSVTAPAPVQILTITPLPPVPTGAPFCGNGCPVRVVTTSAHGYAVGNQPRFYGASFPVYNSAGSPVVNVVDANTFDVNFTFAGILPAATGGWTQANTGVFANGIVTNPHGRTALAGPSSPQGLPGLFLTDNSIGTTLNIVKAEHIMAPVVSVSTQAGNGNSQVAKYLLGQTITSAIASQSGDLVTYTLSAPHDFGVGDTVAVEGVATAAYNSQAMVVVDISSSNQGPPDTFTAIVPGTSGFGPDTGGGRAGRPLSLIPYQSLTIQGVSDARYNLAVNVCPYNANSGPACSLFDAQNQSRMPTALSFSAGIAPGTPLFTAGTGGQVNTITFTTSVPHLLNVPSATVTVAGFQVSGYNGTWRVAGFSGPGLGSTHGPLSTQFTVIPPSAPGVPFPLPSATQLPPASGGSVSVRWNLFRNVSGFDTTNNWGTTASSSSILTDNGYGVPLEVFTHRSSTATTALTGGWSPRTATAAIEFGSGINTLPPWVAAQQPQTFFLPAAGTVHAIAGVGPGSATNTVAPSDLYAAVYAKQPDGTVVQGGGGIYWSCDTYLNTSPVSVHSTWLRRDDIPSPDSDLIWSITPAGAAASDTHLCPVLQANVTTSTIKTYYAALRCPNASPSCGQIYKMANGDGHWVKRNGTDVDGDGVHVIPPGAEVFTIAWDSTYDAVYAGTSAGLYKSSNGGATWVLVGASGKKVRNIVVLGHGTVGISGATASGTTATITTAFAHGLAVGDIAIIANAAAALNGTRTVTSVSGNQFTVTVSATNTALSTAKQTVAGGVTTTTFVTSAAHGLAVGKSATLTVSGVGIAGYNGTWLVTATNATTLTTTQITTPLVNATGGTVTFPATNGTGTVQQVAPRILLGVDDDCGSLDGVFGQAQPSCSADAAPQAVIEVPGGS